MTSARTPLASGAGGVAQCEGLQFGDTGLFCDHEDLFLVASFPVGHHDGLEPYAVKAERVHGGFGPVDGLEGFFRTAESGADVFGEGGEPGVGFFFRQGLAVDVLDKEGGGVGGYLGGGLRGDQAEEDE